MSPSASWLSQHGILEGSRKRKPTQLFTAGEPAVNARSPGGSLREEAGRASVAMRHSEGDHGLSVGAEVIVVKPGKYEDAT